MYLSSDADPRAQTGRAAWLRRAIPRLAAALGRDLETPAPEVSEPLEDWLRGMGLVAHGLRASEVAGWVRSGRVALAITSSRVLVIGNATQRRGIVTAIDDHGEREYDSSLRAIARMGDAGTHWLAISLPDDLEPVCDREHVLTPWQRVAAFARLERRDLWVVAAYAATLGLLTVVTPVATQALVNTIAFGAVLQPLIVLTLALFAGLALAGGLRVLQAYIVEVIQRRVLVRVAEDLTLRIPSVSSAATDEHDLVELNNRFLDTVAVQKSAAELLLVGLGLALQIGVGLLLLAFYHPALLAFSLVLLVALVVVIVQGRGGTSSAIAESKAKYELVAWLDELARQPTLFAGGQAARFATNRSSDLIHRYVEARRGHYRHVFAVLIGGNTLQVLAAVVLLAIGGYLVIERQLTLGQLVAAELVVTAIAAGIGKLGRLAEKTFDLVAAIDKLGHLLDLPVRDRAGDPLPTDGALALAAHEVTAAPHTSSLTASLAPGDKASLDAGSGTGASLLLQVLAGHRAAATGRVRWDGRSRPALDEIARSVQLVDARMPVVSGSVLDNLRIADADLSERHAWAALETVGLASIVDSIGGLHARLLPSGAPLSSTAVKRLLLARVIVGRPRLLLVDEALDFLDPEVVDAIVGEGAPWTAVVVSRDPAVRARLATTLSLSRPTQGGPT